MARPGESDAWLIQVARSATHDVRMHFACTRRDWRGDGVRRRRRICRESPGHRGGRRGERGDGRARAALALLRWRSHAREREPESDLSSDTVATLGLSWQIDAPGVTATPVVYDGIVYWSDWMGGVYASRIDDGSAVWEQRFDARIHLDAHGHGGPRLPADRDALVRALDRETGEEIWTTSIDDNPMAQAWSSPMLAGSTLIVGVGGKGTQQRGSRWTPQP